MDANFVIQTLLISQALARTFNDRGLALDCVKAIETVRELAAKANGWAAQFPRDEDETSSKDGQKPNPTC